MVPLLSKENELVAESLLCGTATRQDLAVASSFLWRTWQIGTKYNQGSEEKEDPFLVNFSPLVCFHEYFQFMIQKNSKTGYSLTIQLWYKCQEAAAVCIPNVDERLQPAESWTLAMQCNLPMRENAFPLQGDYDRQNKAAGNRAIAITHFHLGFEGQRFWHA